MHPLKLRVFQDQIAVQAEFILMDAKAMDQAIATSTRAKSADVLGSSIRDTFRYIQSMLSSCANISKLFWSDVQRPKSTTEREALRAFFQLTPESVFHYRDRSMRNHYDHFDNRIDEWWESSPRVRYVDLSFNGYVLGFEKMEHWRDYEVSTGTVTFLGRALQYKADR